MTQAESKQPFDSKALRHFRHAKTKGIATACTAHHVNFGGACLNCGFDEPAETPAMECWTCAYEGEHNEMCMRLDNPAGGICEEPHTRPFSLYAKASVQRHVAAGHDVRQKGR